MLQNAPREHSAILSNCIKVPSVLKTFVLSIFQCLLKTGFTVPVYLGQCFLLDVWPYYLDHKISLPKRVEQDELSHLTLYTISAFLIHQRSLSFDLIFQINF